MSEDKATYGKLDCRHEQTTLIVDLGLERCDGCGEVMQPKPKLTRYEWLRSLTLEELSEDLVGDITEFLFELIGHPNQVEACKAWLMEEMEDE